MNAQPPIEWSLAAAVNAFLSSDYKDGDVVSHDWLRWALDLPTDNSLDSQLVVLERKAEFKEALLVGHSILLVSLRGHGYTIVPPGAQATVAARIALKEVKRELRKCGKRLEHTRVYELTAAEAQRHTDISVRMAGLRSLFNKQKRNVLGDR